MEHRSSVGDFIPGTFSDRTEMLGIAEAEVISWFAEEGDEVKEHQPLLEVQTDKVILEASFLGRRL